MALVLPHLFDDGVAVCFLGPFDTSTRSSKKCGARGWIFYGVFWSSLQWRVIPRQIRRYEKTKRVFDFLQYWFSQPFFDLLQTSTEIVLS